MDEKYEEALRLIEKAKHDLKEIERELIEIEWEYIKENQPKRRLQ